MQIFSGESLASHLLAERHPSHFDLSSDVMAAGSHPITMKKFTVFVGPRAFQRSPALFDISGGADVEPWLRRMKLGGHQSLDNTVGMPFFDLVFVTGD